MTPERLLEIKAEAKEPFGFLFGPGREEPVEELIEAVESLQQRREELVELLRWCAERMPRLTGYQFWASVSDAQNARMIREILEEGK